MLIREACYRLIHGGYHGLIREGYHRLIREGYRGFIQEAYHSLIRERVITAHTARSEKVITGSPERSITS